MADKGTNKKVLKLKNVPASKKEELKQSLEQSIGNKSYKGKLNSAIGLFRAESIKSKKDDIKERHTAGSTIAADEKDGDLKVLLSPSTEHGSSTGMKNTTGNHERRKSFWGLLKSDDELPTSGLPEPSGSPAATATTSVDGKKRRKSTFSNRLKEFVVHEKSGTEVPAEEDLKGSSFFGKRDEKRIEGIIGPTTPIQPRSSAEKHHHLHPQHHLHVHHHHHEEPESTNTSSARRPDKFRIHSSRGMVVDGKLVLKQDLENVQQQQRSRKESGTHSSLGSIKKVGSHSSWFLGGKKSDGESISKPGFCRRWFGNGNICKALCDPSIKKGGYFRLEPNYPTVCPRCGDGHFVPKWTPTSIYCCVLVPIVGILCCFAFREWRCTKCDEALSLNLFGNSSIEAGRGQQELQRRPRQTPAYGVPSAGGSAAYQDTMSNYAAQPYSYDYGVYDSHYGTDFGHQEESNAQNEKHGRYHVRLPDGRLQIVTYTAGKDGFKADVTYQDGDSSPGSSYSPGEAGNAGGYGGNQQVVSSSSYSGNNRGNRNFVNIMRQINGRAFTSSY